MLAAVAGFRGVPLLGNGLCRSLFPCVQQRNCSVERWRRPVMACSKPGGVARRLPHRAQQQRPRVSRQGWLRDKRLEARHVAPGHGSAAVCAGLRASVLVVVEVGRDGKEGYFDMLAQADVTKPGEGGMSCMQTRRQKPDLHGGPRGGRMLGHSFTDFAVQFEGLRLSVLKRRPLRALQLAGSCSTHSHKGKFAELGQHIGASWQRQAGSGSGTMRVAPYSTQSGGASTLTKCAGRDGSHACKLLQMPAHAIVLSAMQGQRVHVLCALDCDVPAAHHGRRRWGLGMVW